MEQQYGFFGNQLARAVGTPVTNTFSVGAARCEAIVELEARGAGLRVSGRYRAPGGPRWLVIAEAAGHVRGLAIREQRGTRIVGYTPTPTSRTLYGVEGNTLCLAGPFDDVAVKAFSDSS